MTKYNLLTACALSSVAVAMISVAQPAKAVVYTFDIEPSFFSGSPDGSSGSGSFDTINPLTPNQSFFNQPVTNLFNDITVTLNNLNTTPTTTTFRLDDITNIIFSTDGSSNVSDFNFGTFDGGDNGEFTAQGVAPFTFALNDVDTGFVNEYQFTNLTEVATPVPFEMDISTGLLALGAIYGSRKLWNAQKRRSKSFHL